MPAAANLLPITDESWAIRARDVAHRNELLDYAASKGVPVWENARLDESLYLSWYIDLISFPISIEPQAGWTSEEDFKAMCDAYQST